MIEHLTIYSCDNCKTKMDLPVVCVDLDAPGAAFSANLNLNLQGSVISIDLHELHFCCSGCLLQYIANAISSETKDPRLAVTSEIQERLNDIRHLQVKP